MVGLGLAGCAYYNGMYNAQRMAKQAEKAERDGRTFEARNLWAQAEIKADTVLSRHGSSKWRDDALLIKGRALVSRGECEAASPSLEEVLFTSSDSAKVALASFALGSCLAAKGEFAPAVPRLQQALAHSSPEARYRPDAARLLISSLMSLERYAEAAEWSGRYPENARPADRALSLTASGDRESAAAILDSLVSARDTATDWLTVLPALVELAPTMGLQYVDRVVAQDTTDQNAAAELLLAASARLMSAQDTARALSTLEQAAALTRTSNGASRARLLLAGVALARATEPGELDSVTSILEPATQGAFADALRARQLTQAVEGFRVRLDSLEMDGRQSDLELFLSAEFARDSLGAPHLAQGLLERLVAEHPASAYSPKGVLSLALLNPDDGERYRLLLDYAYADSPYVLFVHGTSTPEFEALEDSLRTYGFARLGSDGAARRNRPGARRDNDEDEADEFDSQELP